MSDYPESLWLSISPSFKTLHFALIQSLSESCSVPMWEYCLTEDEPGCINDIVSHLHSYLSGITHPIHLIGHGASGLVGLLYARKYPEHVKSLTLLSVGVHPAIDWQAHYYTRLQLLFCSRDLIVSQMVRELFGSQSPSTYQYLENMLRKDIDTSPSQHSLWDIHQVPADGCPVPLLVCCAANDTIIDPQSQCEWQKWFKPGDRLWRCPKGKHFFHHFYAESVARVIQEFWQTDRSQDERQPSIELEVSNA